MTGLVRVASLSDLPENSLLGVETPDGERVCLVNCGGEVSALSDVCTHQAFPLSAGEVHEDGSVECAWHGARFDCRTGAVRRGPAEEPITVYEVKVEGEEIWVGRQR